MKQILLIAAILFSAATSAQTEKPQWISVEDLYGRYQSTDDFSYLSNALYRCSAISSIFGAIFERDGVAGAEEYSDESFSQILMGNAFTALKQKNQGADIELDKAIADVSVLQSDMYKLMVTNYSSWLSYNYTTFGDYTSEPDMENELRTCKVVTGFANELLGLLLN